MPKTIAEYRLIQEELRLFLSRVDDYGDDGWPKYKQLFAFLRQNLDWSGSEREYRSLKQFGTGPARLVEGLFRYLDERAPARLRSFAGEQGIQLEADRAVGELLERFSSLCSADEVRTDWRRFDSWRSVVSIFAAAFIGDERRMIVRDSADLGRVAEWFITDVGRAVALEYGAADAKTDAEFLALGERHMGRSMAYYRDQLTCWWQTCPWSVAHAVFGDAVVGASVVLPLKPEAYQAVRNGDLSDLEIEADHLQYPTRTLFVNAMTSSYNDLPTARVGWITARQIASVIYQGARLSWDPDRTAKADGPIHVLCVGGSPEAVERLERHGYTRVGVLRGFDVPLYEILWRNPDSAPWLPRSAGQAYSAIIAACYAHFRSTGTQ